MKTAYLPKVHEHLLNHDLHVNKKSELTIIKAGETIGGKKSNEAYLLSNADHLYLSADQHRDFINEYWKMTKYGHSAPARFDIDPAGTYSPAWHQRDDKSTKLLDATVPGQKPRFNSFQSVQHFSRAVEQLLGRHEFYFVWARSSVEKFIPLEDKLFSLPPLPEVNVGVETVLTHPSQLPKEAHELSYKYAQNADSAKEIRKSSASYKNAFDEGSLNALEEMFAVSDRLIPQYVRNLGNFHGRVPYAKEMETSGNDVVSLKIAMTKLEESRALSSVLGGWLPSCSVM